MTLGFSLINVVPQHKVLGGIKLVLPELYFANFFCLVLILKEIYSMISRSVAFYSLQVQLIVYSLSLGFYLNFVHSAKTLFNLSNNNVSACSLF